MDRTKKNPTPFPQAIFDALLSGDDPAAIEAAIAKGDSLGGFDEQGNTPAIWAASMGRAASLLLILNRGGNPGAANHSGYAPAHFAALNGNVACLEAIAAAGGDLDARTANGTTPAIVAAENGKIQALAALDRLGADIFLMDDAGRGIQAAAQGLLRSNKETQKGIEIMKERRELKAAAASGASKKNAPRI